jgi:hypothetical protein
MTIKKKKHKIENKFYEFLRAAFKDSVKKTISSTPINSKATSVHTKFSLFGVMFVKVKTINLFPQKNELPEQQIQ